MCGSPFENKQGVCHIVALPFTLKKYLNAKKKNYGNSNISSCKNIIFKKIPLKETKILQDIITLITSLKFQHNKAKISSFKNPPIKIDLLPSRGQNPLLYSESKHNILALVGKANKDNTN
jgi:hypothetical protein